MYITFDVYEALGYSLVPELAFERFEAMARLTADRLTMNRLRNATLSDDNKRGVCELIDLHYSDMNPEQAQMGALASFTNMDYSETYATAPTKTLGERIDLVIANYFTRAQRYRGVI